MAFYIEKAIFVNRAPFEHIELDFKDNGVNVLSAINGNGKTTILSHITDAFYELAKQVFYNEFEGKQNKYYRVSSPFYNLNYSIPSFVYLRFIHNGECIDYIDIQNICTKEQYETSIVLDSKIPFDIINKTFANNRNIKLWSLNNKSKIENHIFANHILTYFPAYRYETPSYLNNPYGIKIDYNIKSKFVGFLDNQIEVVSDLPSLINWFLDVLLDMKIKEEARWLPTGNGYAPIVLPTKERIFVWDNLNKIVSSALSSKHYNGIVRLGIGPRTNGFTRVGVMNDIIVEGQNTSKSICPSLLNLSAGELSLISIFGEILHQADNLQNNIQLSEVNGIVLIDEVDKHLHITLQKEVLPKLFNLFPNVQFIVSSHSPFLSMGLAEDAAKRTQIIDLDNNGLVCEPTNNDLYKEVYEMMINENQRFYDNFKQLQKEINELNKPIVITEGKTDIVHILKAKEKLGVETDFNTIPEVSQPDGYSYLNKMLEQLCKVKQSNKIIAVFDRDVPKIVQEMDNNGVGYKSYGNNVYGFCISAPQSRINNGQNEISIEYLYSDDEIHTVLSNGCKLFFGDEFSETTGRHNKDKNLILKNQSDRGKHKIVENNGDQAVYDLTENNVLAKKSEYAKAIKNDLIQISPESWDNFKHIFEKIETIINLSDS